MLPSQVHPPFLLFWILVLTIRSYLFFVICFDLHFYFFPPQAEGFILNSKHMMVKIAGEILI